MPNFDAASLVKTQILTLVAIISDRGLVFESLTPDMLDTMSLSELERVHRAYHELVYASPLK